MFRQNLKHLNCLSVLGFSKEKKKPSPSPFTLRENTATIIKPRTLPLDAYLSKLSLKYMFLGDQRSDLVPNAINTKATVVPNFSTVEKELAEIMNLINHVTKPDECWKLYQALYKSNQLNKEKKPRNMCKTLKISLFQIQCNTFERINKRNIMVPFRFPNVPNKIPNKYDLEDKQSHTLETYRSLSQKSKKISAPLNTMVIAVNEGQVKDKDDESTKNKEPSKCTLLSSDDAVCYLMFL
ncbi:uncharacterized protein LOC119682206 [Teleopsis dalmanni]|uniref:uncharacterized protein LOC119682206 n=1 Tax=Teleopsis dalmanni TaxID=139649 RepID=UPI0018CD0D32|nr:uncharacterized protein LOC119682206 [Teleopsis dalmanni]